MALDEKSKVRQGGQSSVHCRVETKDIKSIDFPFFIYIRCCDGRAECGIDYCSKNGD